MIRYGSMVLGLIAATTLSACSATTNPDTRPATGPGATNPTPNSAPTGTGAIAATGKPVIGGADQTFCDISFRFRAKYSGDGAFGNLAAENPQDVQKFFVNFGADIKTWEAAAPADIRADIGVEVKQITDLDSLLAQYGYDFRLAAAAESAKSTPPTTASTADSSNAKTANDRITAYMQSHCGPEIDPTVTTG
jgi:hypothetical protein